MKKGLQILYRDVTNKLALDPPNREEIAEFLDWVYTLSLTEKARIGVKLIESHYGFNFNFSVTCAGAALLTPNTPAEIDSFMFSVAQIRGETEIAEEHWQALICFLTYWIAYPSSFVISKTTD